MLTRVVGRRLLQTQGKHLPKVIKPGNHVCFCGCQAGNPCVSKMVNIHKRNFQGNLNLDSTANLVPQQYKAADQVALWKDQADKKNSLSLKTNDEIEEYVLSIVKNYFRTTKKASVSLDSAFTDHGLDSLDVIELVIQVEDELGYLIDAEKLELFSKPKHFVNFIVQMEAYKAEHNRLPHEGVHAESLLKSLFPGIPYLTK